MLYLGFFWNISKDSNYRDCKIIDPKIDKENTLQDDKNKYIKLKGAAFHSYIQLKENSNKTTINMSDNKLFIQD